MSGKAKNRETKRPLHSQRESEKLLLEPYQLNDV